MPKLSPDVTGALQTIRDPAFLADFVAANILRRTEDKMEVLNLFDPMERALKVKEILARENELGARMKERLQSLGRVRLLAPAYSGGILLFYAEGIPSDVLGRELDNRGICVRSGFHCAALAHRTLETPSDGAVRVSAGSFNRASDADALWKAMKDILR